MKNIKTTPRFNKKILIWVITVAVIAIGVLSFALADLISALKEYGDENDIYSNLEKLGPKNIDEKDLNSFDVDFEFLKQINPDIVAWIVMPDTRINHPVVQTQDNEKYLDITFENTQNSAGTIFLDFLNQPDFSDFNNIIYGHNMNDGSMFHDLVKLKDAGYYNLHNAGYLITPGQVFRFEIFAVNLLDSEDEYRMIGFASKEDFLDFIEKYKSSSIVKKDIEISVKDKILTLSTCDDDRSGKIEDVRLVVMAKLIPLN